MVASSRSINPGATLLPLLLRKCTDLAEGRRLHAQIQELNSGEESPFVGNLLVQMYGRCKSVEESRLVFHTMRIRNLFSWNILLSAFAHDGHFADARELFYRMPSWDMVSWTSVLSVVIRIGDLQQAKHLFQAMPERCPVAWNVMLAANAQLGHMFEADALFERMPQRSVNSWNIMLKATSDKGDLEAAKLMLDNLPQRDIVSWNTYLTAICHHKNSSSSNKNNQVFDHNKNKEVLNLSDQKNEDLHKKKKKNSFPSKNEEADLARKNHQNDLGNNKDVFNRMPQHDVISCSILLTALAEEGDLENARNIFDSMAERDPRAWSSLLVGCLLKGHSRSSLELFCLMDLEGVQPDEATYTRLFDACADSAILDVGELLHSSMVTVSDSDRIVGTALLNMYSKCGRLDAARKVFDKLRSRDVVSWTAMVVAYAQNGHIEEAEKLFRESPERNLVAWNVMLTAYVQNGLAHKCSADFLREMEQEGVIPNESSYISLLDACCSSRNLSQGRLLHSLVIGRGFESHPVVATGLINMYGRCGCLEEARLVFDGLIFKDLIAWTVMISAYSQNGCGKEVVQTFLWLKLDGFVPNEVVFTSLLSACSHAGMLDDARQCFLSLTADYGMVPAMDHYVCIADLLGRLGRIQESDQLLETMPYEPHAVAWTSFVHACGSHGDEKRARAAFQRSNHLQDPSDCDRNHRYTNTAPKKNE